MILLLLSFGLVLTAGSLVVLGMKELSAQTQRRHIVQSRYAGLGELAAARHEVEANWALLKDYADTGDPIPYTNVYVHKVGTDVYELKVRIEYKVDRGEPVGETLIDLATVGSEGGTGLGEYAILSGEGSVEYWKSLYEPNDGLGGTLYGNLMYFGRMDDNHAHNPDFGVDGWFIWDDMYDHEDNWHGPTEIPPQWKPNRADWFQGEDWNIKPHDWTDLDRIEFGDIAPIGDLADEADKKYTGDIAVEFDGDQVIITPGAGPPETYPISDLDIIYTDGSITGLSGTVTGSITVASEGGVTITGSIVYEDSGGDSAMLGGGGSEDFVPNPAYDGGSNLGVYTEGNIILSGSVPTNTELNGLYFSRDGNITIDGYDFGELADEYYRDFWPDPNLPVEYTGNFGVKDSLRVFGSLQYKNFFLPYAFDINQFFTGLFPYPVVPSDHRFLDRKMIYDPQLKDTPPPGYPGYGAGEPGFVGTFPELPD